MRIIKEHGERRTEIIDAAENLFAAKGYASTAISDILEALNIAKGTFYHYFASKEALMDAVIERYIDAEMAVAQAVADDPKISAHEKMFRILTDAGRDNERGDRLEKEASAVGNADMHQRTMASIVLRLSPILEGIVRQGMREGTFNTAYPKECMNSFPNTNKMRAALDKLDWLVCSELHNSETTDNWKRPGVDPKACKTEVFLLPSAHRIEKEGTISNSGRWLQWFDMAFTLRRTRSFREMR